MSGAFFFFSFFDDSSSLLFEAGSETRFDKAVLVKQLQDPPVSAPQLPALGLQECDAIFFVGSGNL